MGASLLGANKQKKAAQAQAAQQYANDKETAIIQREWFLDDRQWGIDRDREVEAEARAYDREQLDESRAYSRQVLGQLTEDAQAAGFNPLTVLRGGGASSYNAGAGMAPLSATRSFSSPPQPQQYATRQAVGGSPSGVAMQAVGDFLENFDPFADQKKEQEYQLVASQIAALNASALSGVPRGAGSYASSTTERRPSGVGGALGKPAKWQAGDVNVTNPFQTEPVNKDWSDAATWEQRYGEPGSWIGGVVVGGADAWDYANRKASKFTQPGGAVRSAARWVDGLLGTGKNKKTGRLSKPFNGGGGGW